MTCPACGGEHLTGRDFKSPETAGKFDRIAFRRWDVEDAHFCDDHGRPAGGMSQAIGVVVSWQRGPLNRKLAANEPARNGAAVEDLLEICLRRLAWYQAVDRGRFACRENREAITGIETAMAALHARTTERRARGVEGTHEA